MSEMAIPSALYKYLPPVRVPQVLHDLRIRFSQVSVLNDAEEFRPQYNAVGTRSEIETAVRNRLPVVHQKDFAALREALAPHDSKHLLDDIVPIMADRIEANFETSVRKLYERTRSQLRGLILVGNWGKPLGVVGLRRWW